MSNQTMNDLQQKIIQNRRVNADDVRRYEQYIEADWVVDQGEVESLLKVNHAIGNNDEECPQWSDFFVKTVTRLVVMDMFTPGQIDRDEGDWLGELLDRFSVDNESERKLLAEIRSTATLIAGRLAERFQS